jgi:glutamine synthetase type I
MDKHHHEVAAAQHELGLTYGTLVETADRMQIYKYVVHMVAHAYGKTATFMPKPIAKDNGSGMHVHMSIWNGGKPLFAGNGYAGLSETALYFIGGVIKHAKALNAFTNPTTNSYKRLVPGFEAPVLLAYSSRNRSASCRIPYGAGEKAKRVEFRFPDALANPYLAYAAILMAGHRRHPEPDPPGEPMDKNLYDLPPQELVNVPTVCGSLREALVSLQTTEPSSPAATSSRRPDRRLYRAQVGRADALGDDSQARSNTTCIIRAERTPAGLHCGAALLRAPPRAARAPARRAPAAPRPAARRRRFRGGSPGP